MDRWSQPKNSFFDVGIIRIKIWQTEYPSADKAVDRDDENKLKELPVGDNLDLTGHSGDSIVGAGNIQATGLTINNVSYIW